MATTLTSQRILMRIGFRILLCLMGWAISFSQAREEGERIHTVRSNGLGHRVNFEAADEPRRTRVGAFSVLLAPKPMEWQPRTYNDMYDVVQEVIVDHIRENTPVGFALRYFVIPDFDVEDLPGNVSVLRIGESAAAFDLTDPSERNLEVPDQRTVELWAQEAIDTNLVTAMNAMFTEKYDQTNFVDIQQARYMSATDDSDVDGVQNGPLSSGSASRSSGGGANTALSVSVAVAGAAILLLAALLVRSHRQGSKEAVTTPVSLDTSAAQSFDSNHPRPLRPILHLPTVVEEAASSQGRSVSGSMVDSADLRSLPESESSWTIATDVGDSTALQSGGLTHASAAIVSAESFQHDRQIYIQKDMLTTSWSGQNASMGRKGSRVDSVLQPSHFSASSERNGRRQWTDFDQSPSPFVVTSHDDSEMGEEVFLMPDDGGEGGATGELA